MKKRCGRLGRVLPASSLLACLLVAASARAQAVDEASEEEPEFEAVAEVEAPPREATKRTLAREQLTTVPGTRGDALRAIEIMPGVARTQFGTNPGPPSLRGGPPSESVVLLDGAQMPLLYHFGGLTSIFNSRLLESVVLYPGNFSARYGRVGGGVVEVNARDPKSDRLHAELELSLIDSYALAEGPLGQRSSLALAARRSNIDPFIDAVVTDDSTAVIAAPVYWDYQAIFAHRFSEAHKLRVMAFGSYDSFELHLGEAAAEDPALRGQFGSSEQFHRLQLELENHFSEHVQQKVMLSAGVFPGRGLLGNVNYDFKTYEAHLRSDWSVFAAPWLRLDAGIDVVALSVDFRYQGPTPPPDEGVPSQGTLASSGTQRIQSQLRTARPAAYFEMALTPREGLLIVPGVRVDYYRDADAWTVDPRVTTRLQVGEATTLKAGAGYYSQPPQYWEVMPEFGNPEVQPSRTLQTSIGVERALGKHLRLDLDGFFKRWEDRVVSTEGGAPPRYVNAGTGKAFGLEFLGQAELSERTRAFLSYTLSRSTRRDVPGGEERLFDRDQTHNLSLAASYDLGSGWLAGARFRYVTGNPYSPVQGSVYDASHDTYRPLYGALNSARNTAFHQLDLRIEKLWRWGPVGLTAYLEIMNTYNASNQEGRRYSFDYSESAGVTGMPIFPNLGVRGEL